MENSTLTGNALLHDLIMERFHKTSNADKLEIMALIGLAESNGAKETVEEIKFNWVDEEDGKSCYDSFMRADKRSIAEQRAEMEEADSLLMVTLYDPMTELNALRPVSEAELMAKGDTYLEKLKEKQAKQFDNLHGWNKSMLERRQA